MGYIACGRKKYISLNRAAAIWNSRIQWPRSRFLLITYRGYDTLVLQDKKTEFLLSKKGVGQGDPLSMLMYAAAVMPLIKSLSNPSNWIQNWYADDSSCIAKLTHLRDWFDKLCEHGPKYGYYPEVDKCIVMCVCVCVWVGVGVCLGINMFIYMLLSFTKWTLFMYVHAIFYVTFPIIIF